MRHECGGAVSRNHVVHLASLLFAFAMIAIIGCSVAASQTLPSKCSLRAISVSLSGPKCARAWFDANLKINEIQTIGTAESYKLRPSLQLMTLVKMGSPEDARQIDFSEPAISKQLDSGARSLEFDIAYDPKGGLYANPSGAMMAMEFLSDSYTKAMSSAGFKVIHILDIDFNSSCWTLKDCLQSVADWSRRHPDHLPIVIALRSNDDATAMPHATQPAKFTATTFDALDARILTVFRRDELITPDIVRGNFPTLREAVLAHNWPALGASRGKVVFLLDDDAGKVALYRGARSSLEGRLMFINTDENSSAAGFVTVENPVTAFDKITADVKAGFIVRTFADANAQEARSNIVSRRDKALASGAQIISTNFLVPDMQIGKYAVHLSQGQSGRCDPVPSLAKCSGADVESGRALPLAGR